MTDNTALNTTQAAAFLGLAAKTLANARAGALIGGIPGPKYRKLGVRCVYLKADLDAWRAQFEERQ